LHYHSYGGRMDITEKILEQGKVLVRGIKALETIQKNGPVERVQVWFLLQAYRRRLRGIIEAAPSWMGEEILSASEGIDDPAAIWLSEN
jgi:hypothetical protein